MQRVRMLAVLGLFVGIATGAAAAPTVLRTPGGGVQPQAAIDAKGVLHLVYLKGKDSESDVFYVRKEPASARFSEPIRVNSVPGSAMAMGTIRGAHIALGKNGRVHIAWNGSGKATPKGPNNGNPMLYARLDDSGKAFERQRNLMTQTFSLDGGGSVAADERGNVYVAWHAPKVGAANGEANRQVWVAISSDDGKTFAREVAASTDPTGACGCCGMKAFADSKGALHLLYRTASGGSRDMYQLTSKDQGKSFSGATVHRLKAESCMMSSEALVEGPEGVLAGWETAEQVYFARAEPGTSDLTRPIGAPGPAGRRKHPALAGNDKGETILVWTEGTAWSKGGALAWQVFDKTGKPTEDRGRVDGGIPVWGLAAVVAGPNGFIIVH